MMHNLPPPSHAPHALWRLAPVCAAVLLLTACELQIPGVWPDPRAVQRESEAKAIGGACRHALRGLEDCYTLNPKAPKSAVFNGWKEMDAYMRENKMDGTPSMLGKVDPKAARKKSADEDEEEESATAGKRS